MPGRKKVRVRGIGSRIRCRGCYHEKRHNPLIVLFVGAFKKCRLAERSQLLCLENDGSYRDVRGVAESELVTKLEEAHQKVKDGCRGNNPDWALVPEKKEILRGQLRINIKVAVEELLDKLLDDGTVGGPDFYVEVRPDQDDYRRLIVTTSAKNDPAHRLIEEYLK